MRKPFISIEARRDSIVALALTIERGRYQKIVAADHAAPANGQSVVEALDQSLARLSATLPIANCSAGIGLSPTWLSFRNMAMPFKHPNKIRQILPMEIQQQLVDPPEPMPLPAFTCLSTARPDNQTEILAAVIEPGRLANIEAVAARHGLHVEILTAAGLATALMIAHHAPQSHDMILIDTELRGAGLFFLHHGSLLTARAILLPAAPAARMAAINQQVRLSLASLDEFSPADYQPDTIVLAGPDAECASDMTIETAQAQATVLPLDAAALGLDQQTATADIPAHSYGAVALAAMRSQARAMPNFHRHSHIFSKLWQAYRRNLITSGILLSMCLVLLVGAASVDIYLRRQQVKQLDRHLAAMFTAVFPQAAIVDPLQQMRVELAQAQKLTAAFGDNRIRLPVIDILKQISRAVPANMQAQLQRLTIAPGSIILAGTSAAFKDVDEIKKQLEKQPGFQQVIITSANADPTDKRIRFRLKIDM